MRRPVWLSLMLGVALVLAAGAIAAGPPGLANGSFTTDLNGFALHYEVHGRGPVLMTVPNSWGLTWQGLQALYRPLERYFTVVYFDPRGMGQSGPVRQDSDMSMAAVREDFDALRRHLGLAKVNAIGWSNGAINLILLASERPDTIASAIFLHGEARETQDDQKTFQVQHPELVQLYKKLFQEMGAKQMSQAEADARIRRFYLEEYFPYLWADPTAARPKLEKIYADTGFSWRHAQYSMKEMPAFDFRDRLPKITARTLVIAGAHDLIPPEKAREIGEGIPGARFVLFAHSGHFAPVEEPDAFIAAVRAFLARR